MKKVFVNGEYRELGDDANLETVVRVLLRQQHIDDLAEAVLHRARDHRANVEVRQQRDNVLVHRA